MLKFKIVAMFFLLLATQGFGAASLPVIKNLGVAPVEWTVKSNQVLDIQANREVLNKIYPGVVRASGRFLVVNDTLTQRLITQDAGRKVLKDEYELDAALLLEAELSDDSVRLALKLLDNELHHLLIERKVMSRSEFAAKTKNELEAVLQDLVFRLVNLIPADVYVTSLQGKFVTLSGGQEQGLAVGDQLALQSTQINNTHPADGTWLGYQNTLTGNVEVVDLKNKSSVGKILQENSPHAISVGNGAVVSGLPARVFFKKQQDVAQRQTLKPSQSHVELVTPLYGPDAKAPTNTAAPAQEGKQGVHKVEATEGEGVTSQVVAAQGTAEAGSADKAEKSKENLGDYLQDYADSGYAWFGVRQWSFSGPASASSNFPFWLINHFGAEIRKEIMPKIKLSIGGELGFGGTRHGTYSEMAGQGRLVYEDESSQELRGYFDRFYFGALGSYRGLTVNDEKFGGGDWLTGGLVAGVQSKLFIVGESKIIDSYAEFSLSPLTIGRFGYAGKRRGVKSSMGWDMRLGGYLEGTARSLEWGGALAFGGTGMLFDDSKEGSFSTFNLQGLVRYRL